MKKIYCVLAIGSAWLANAETVRADDFVGTDDIAHPREWTPAFAASKVEGSVDLWPARNNLVATLGIDVQLRLGKRVFLDISHGAAFANVNDALDSGDYMTFGNPTIGLHVAGAAAPNLHMFVGGGFTVPLLHDPDTGMSNAAFYGARIRGYSEVDRFVRGHAAVRAAAGLEWHPGGPILLRVETKPVVFIPTNDKHPVISETRAGVPETGGGQMDLFIENAVDIEARAAMGLGFGVRLQGVFMPLHDDLLQTTVEPFLALTPRRGGFFMRAGLPLALDPDLGFGLSEDKLAAVRVSLGGRW